MHGEVVDGNAAGFGDVFGAGAWLVVEESGDVSDIRGLFPAEFDDAVAGGDRSDHGIERAIDAHLGAFGGDAGPAVCVAEGERGDPDVVLGQVSAVVAGAVSFLKFFDVDDTSLEADRWAKIENPRLAKFIFGIDAEDGHAGADHV